MFLAENLNIQRSASIAFDWSNTLWDKPKPIYAPTKSSYFASENPYTDRKSKSKRISFLLFLLCSFFMNELMLTHHELASPRFLMELLCNSPLHELNCNQCAVRHNSCRRQFTKARLPIHAGRKVAIHLRILR